MYPPRDKVILSLQVPTGDPDIDHHMRSLIKSTGNLAIQKFRYLANWVFHSVHNFVGGTIRQAAALGFLGTRVPKRVNDWQIEAIYVSEPGSRVRTAAEIGVMRMAAVNNEARYYMLREVRYPASRAEDMRRREVQLAHSTAWALARNEAMDSKAILRVLPPLLRKLVSAMNLGFT